MLLDHKELKKSIPLQLKKRRGWAFANRNQKINSKIMEFFKSSKAITRGCGSKILLRNKTLRLHFQISNPTFFLSLSHFEAFKGLVPNLTPCFFNPIVQKVDTLRRRITSGPKLYVFCVYIITENWHHLSILQYLWTFLIPLFCRCKWYFSWILTYMNFYLLTTQNCFTLLLYDRFFC